MPAVCFTVSWESWVDEMDHSTQMQPHKTGSNLHLGRTPLCTPQNQKCKWLCKSSSSEHGRHHPAGSYREQVRKQATLWRISKSLLKGHCVSYININNINCETIRKLKFASMISIKSIYSFGTPALLIELMDSQVLKILTSTVHTSTVSTCKLHTESPMGFKPRIFFQWGSSANCATWGIM